MLLWSANAEADGVARLVLVVGNNRPVDGGEVPLRFADDDAIRTYQGFEGLAEERVLLARLDRESQGYAESFPVISAPTRAEVRRAATVLRARAAELHLRGRFVELLFFFSGHGGLENGAPYLALEDGRLGRDDLEELFLTGNPADIVHVLIDSCQAASFVESRGPVGGDRDPVGAAVLPFGSLVERHPRAGFVVTAAAGSSAFEWSRFGSGIASHLIRSALSGAADMAPPDGRVTYDELDSFLRTATQDILPSDYRQEIRVLAPRALPSAAILELPRTPWSTELILDRPGRYTVRDEDGRRIVDLRHGRGLVRLLLPPYSRRFVLVERQEPAGGCGPTRRPGSARCRYHERTFEIPAGRHIEANALTPAETTVLARGLVDDSVFEALFASPYDAASVTAHPVVHPVVDPVVREPVQRTTQGGFCPSLRERPRELVDPYAFLSRALGSGSRPARPRPADDALGLRSWED